jgi:methyl-accepting chemotaxis protein
MPILVGTGSSKQTFTEPAVKEAVQIAQAKLGGQVPHLAIVFASVHYEQAKITELLTSILPEQTRIVGCSAAGEITETGVEETAIAIMLLSLPGIQIASTVVDPVGNTKQSGVNAGTQLIKTLQKKPKAILVFADSLVADTTAFVDGLTQAVGHGSIIAGTLAGDDLLFKRTYQYHQKDLYTGKVVVVALDGPIAVSLAGHHGWRPLGTEKRIKAHGNLIQAIDGKAALDLLEEYFGGENIAATQQAGLTRLLLPYPLGAWDEKSGHWLVRSIFSITPKGEFVVSASLPNNPPIRFMVGANSELMAAAELAAHEAKQQLNAMPKAILNFSGIARHAMLHLQAGEEVQKIVAAIDPGVPLLGCYNYGEIITVQQGVSQQTIVQNQMSTVMVLGE